MKDSDTYEIVFMDEMALKMSSLFNNYISPKGQRALIPKDQQLPSRTDSLSVITFATRHSIIWFQTSYAYTTTWAVNEAFKAVLKCADDSISEGKKIVFYFDNASYHNQSDMKMLITEYKRTTKSKRDFILYFSPTYCPDLNLVETINSHAKAYFARERVMHDEISETRESIDRFTKQKKTTTVFLQDKFQDWVDNFYSSHINGSFVSDRRASAWEHAYQSVYNWAKTYVECDGSHFQASLQVDKFPRKYVLGELEGISRNNAVPYFSRRLNSQNRISLNQGKIGLKPQAPIKIHQIQVETDKDVMNVMLKEQRAKHTGKILAKSKTVTRKSPRL